MNNGKIVFLTGTSSSGKTSLSRALQNMLPEPYYWLSLDTFTDEIAPEKFKKFGWPEIYGQCCNLLYRTVKMYSDLGVNVIVDSVTFSIARDYIELLRQYPILLVRVICNSIDELRRREMIRGDRDIGQAESQLDQFDTRIVYDITVDTFEKSIAECAEIIAKMCSNTESYRAFQKMYDHTV